MRSQNTLIVFTKAPYITRVKTRMYGVFTHRQCLYLHKQLYKNTLQQVKKSRHYRVVVYSLGAGVADGQKQVGNNLAERMFHAIQTELKSARRVCLIGSDSFDLNANYISQAFKALDNSKLVLGPTNDGGYLLVGAKNHIAYDVFKRVSWGSSQVLQQTRRNVEKLNTTMTCLDRVIDIDCAEDWEQLSPYSLPSWAQVLRAQILNEKVAM